MQTVSDQWTVRPVSFLSERSDVFGDEETFTRCVCLQIIHLNIFTANPKLLTIKRQRSDTHNSNMFNIPCGEEQGTCDSVCAEEDDDDDDDDEGKRAGLKGCDEM